MLDLRYLQQPFVIQRLCAFTHPAHDCLLVTLQLHKSYPAVISSGWMGDVAEMEDQMEAHQIQFQGIQTDHRADAVDLADPAQYRPLHEHPIRDENEVPTEPATSPRQVDPDAREWPFELQLPTRECGPHSEPEQYPTRYVMNGGQWAQDEHEAHLHTAAQATNLHVWNREAREEVERANREHARQMEDWRARVKATGFKESPSVPQGPPPKGVSSTRVLPNVHEALRRHEPTSKASKEGHSNNRKRHSSRVLQRR